ncbi:MAG: L-rhamnose mutarotase [Candidatus Latescibacteria bacterium]|nr:L-rhamnose mutarotase [Candidatus Latescibacterota bacterium]
MQRVGFMLKVKQEKMEEYKKHHENIWPEMLEALSEAGWHNYSLFMTEEGVLFGYVETPDFDQALAKMAETDVNTRWQDFMAPYFENIGGKHADDNMVPLERVFYLE